MAKKYNFTKSFTFDGKRYFVHADTLEEAIEKKTRKLCELEQKQGEVPTVSNTMKVSEWAEIALSTYKPSVSESTMKDMRYRIEKHILSEIGSLQLKHVTPLQCQKIMSAQKGMSDSHIKKLSQELHFIFETARKNHLIVENPADFISAPDGTKGRRRSITDTEREHFISVWNKTGHKFDLFAIMLYCGCRPKEAAEARGGDIFVEGGKPMLHIRGTKTENSDRSVPIPSVLYASIKDTPKKSTIATSEAGRKITKSTYTHLVKRLRREMNIDMGCKMYRNALVPPYPLAEDFVPYFFRHTYCTDLKKAGVDVRVAQRLMGHASIAITSDIYTHVDMGDISKAADLIEKNLS